MNLEMNNMTLKAEEVRLGNHVLYNGVPHVVDRLIENAEMDVKLLDYIVWLEGKVSECLSV